MKFSNVFAIYKRELKRYFNTPLAYIVLIIFLIVSGYFFSYGQTGMFAYGQADMRIIFQIMHIIFVVFIPAISMGLIAEERSRGTLHLLVTLPVRDFEIILGKYLAALTLIVIYLILTLRYPLILDKYGDLDWGPTTGGYIGLFLVGAVYLAIGMYASSISPNQITAFILGVILCFAFQMTDQLPTLFQSGGALGEIGLGSIVTNVIVVIVSAALVTLFIHYVSHSVSLTKSALYVAIAVVVVGIVLALAKFLPGVFLYLSLNQHFRNIARGVIDTRDIVYYLSLITAFLYLATYSLEGRKWK
ncbi:MAG TPA: hypothetical protein ENG11_05230, partial [candidate division Zixibacteria bacterium]|nr:hypothetical protein [candidate division Zixibacteria bacterium]